MTAIHARLGRVEQTLADLLERVRNLEDHASKTPERHLFGREPAQKK